MKSNLLQVAECALEYIDALPKDIQLPVMPGFDRDWANDVIAQGDKGDDDVQSARISDLLRFNNEFEAQARAARAALKIAIGHIEHMSAWIEKQNAGYSFESIGEDMPGLRAALKRPFPLQQRKALDRETIQALLDLLNPLHGSLDNQLYDERAREGFDAPRDCERQVMVTDGQERDLTHAVVILEDTLRATPTTGPELVFWYRNYRGEEGYRRAIPLKFFFGSTEWHEKPQMLMRAFDVEKNAERDFAVADMSGFVGPSDIEATTPGAAEAWALCEALRADEGSQVLLVCDNPDFNGQPNNAVECVADWTGWDNLRFTGDTIVDALRAARDAKTAAQVP